MSFSLSTHQLIPADFSIITIHHGSGDPSDPLLKAIPSLANQPSIKSEQLLEHLGGVNLLWNKISKEFQLSKRASQYTLRLFEEKNITSYEGLLRATTRASGNIIGFLQPEEEYLPQSLIAVEKFFAAHPKVDFLLTGAIIHDERTNKISSYPAPPLLEYFWTARPEIIPSTLFVRASLFKNNFPLNPAYEELIFEEWLLRVLQSEKKFAALSLTTTRTLKSTMTKKNQQELPSPPTWMRFLTPWWKLRFVYEFRRRKH